MITPGGRVGDSSPLGTKGPRKLDDYVRAIAHALMRDHGFTRSHAIAVAKNSLKRWSAGGGKVRPQVRAGAAAHLATQKAIDASGRGRSTNLAVASAQDNARVTVACVTPGAQRVMAELQRRRGAKRPKSKGKFGGKQAPLFGGKKTDLAVVDLVGPKGYVHGWIKVGGVPGTSRGVRKLREGGAPSSRVKAGSTRARARGAANPDPHGYLAKAPTHLLTPSKQEEQRGARAVASQSRNGVHPAVQREVDALPQSEKDRFKVEPYPDGGFVVKANGDQVVPHGTDRTASTAPFKTRAAAEKHRMESLAWSRNAYPPKSEAKAAPTPGQAMDHQYAEFEKMSDGSLESIAAGKSGFNARDQLQARTMLEIRRRKATQQAEATGHVGNADMADLAKNRSNQELRDIAARQAGTPEGRAAGAELQRRANESVKAEAARRQAAADRMGPPKGESLAGLGTPVRPNAGTRFEIRKHADGKYRIHDTHNNGAMLAASKDPRKAAEYSGLPNASQTANHYNTEHTARIRDGHTGGAVATGVGNSKLTSDKPHNDQAAGGFAGRKSGRTDPGKEQVSPDTLKLYNTARLEAIASGGGPNAAAARVILEARARKRSQNPAERARTQQTPETRLMQQVQHGTVAEQRAARRALVSRDYRYVPGKGWIK